MSVMLGRAKKSFSKSNTSYLDSNNEGGCLQKTSMNINTQAEERDYEEGVTLHAIRGYFPRARENWGGNERIEK